MSGEYTKRFLEVLNTTFYACDENGSGLVEINRLIDFLISQEPSWQDNEIVREEFYKVLHANFNYMITKDDFIKSLLEWFEASLCLEKPNGKGEKTVIDAGKCSNSTSGISEPSEITSGSSTNSIEEIYSGTNFVTDEQTFTNEGQVDEISLNDSGNSQEDLRLVKLHQSEITTLLRKNEYLENINNSLLGQFSCLEDTLAKKNEESEDYKNQLVETRKRLELQIKKYEETEDRINVLTEENKSMAIRLSQSENEATKLNAIVSCLDEKLESSVNENTENNYRIEELKNKLNTLTDKYSNSVKLIDHERKGFKSKEEEREIAWREVIIENQKLQHQLESNRSYTEDVMIQLKTAQKAMSEMQSASIKNVMKTDSSSSLLSGDNSKVFTGENFFLGDKIPFQASLLAELNDEMESKKGECCCVCKRNIALSDRPVETSDIAVGTCAVKTEEKSTMTTLLSQQKYDPCSNVEQEDVHVKSFKRSPKYLRSNNMFHILKSRRSSKKWASLLGVIFVLSFLLLFFSFQILTLPNKKHSHNQIYYFNCFFDLLHIHIDSLDTFIPIR